MSSYHYDGGFSGYSGYSSGGGATHMSKRRLHHVYRKVYEGELAQTPGGLTKADLTKNKKGVIVSKEKSERAKKSPWIKFVRRFMDDDEPFAKTLKKASRAWAAGLK